VRRLCRSSAEDLTSETFLRVLRRISTFTWQSCDFGAWLVAIARNLVADHFKPSRYRLEVSTGEMLDSDEIEPSAEESVLASLSNKALFEAINQLSQRYREAAALRYFLGLSHAQIAESLGISEATVRSLLRHARERLHRALTPNSLPTAGCRAGPPLPPDGSASAGIVP
jgi:RNA polymerase sigma-70 factor (ECF subfamily)